jgi:hypothetical protein
MTNKINLLSRIFPTYTKWKLLEVYYFNHSWYVVHVRENVNTGYKHFKCKRFITWHYNRDVKNLSIEGIESVLQSQPSTTTPSDDVAAGHGAC